MRLANRSTARCLTLCAVPIRLPWTAQFSIEVDPILPMVLGDERLALGFAKLGWFGRLKASARMFSRSALYRHFADKQSLLATVGKEGFRKLRQTIADAWEQNGSGRAGFQAMGKAYVQFAVAHPSHYRVMFGGFIESAAKDDHFVAEANAAFQVLVDALVEQQNAGGIRRDDPVLMARFMWALVHGTAMLVIDGQLPEAAQTGALEHYALERLDASIRQETLHAE